MLTDRLPRPCLPVLLCLLAGPPCSAGATEGNIFARGTVFNAATYVGHPKHGTHSSYYGNSPEQVVDINIGQRSWDDEGTPLLAPEDGIVTMIHANTDSWGYSVEWRNAQGTERLFLAHLKSVAALGPVQAGEQIGELGGSGGWNPHLHIERAGGWVVLSGRELRPPVNPSGNGLLYVSNGPLSLEQQELAAVPQPSWQEAESVTTAADAGGGSSEDMEGPAAVLPAASQ